MLDCAPSPHSSPVRHGGAGHSCPLLLGEATGTKRELPMATELVNSVAILGAVCSMFLTLFSITSCSLVVQQGPVSRSARAGSSGNGVLR